MGSNPDDAAILPVPCSVGTYGARPDADRDDLCWTAFPGAQTDNEEVNWHTDNLSNETGTVLHPDPDADGQSGDLDIDSDGDTLVDGCEVMMAGTSPENPDTDGDTVPDNLEVVGANAGALGNALCQQGALSIKGLGSYKYVGAINTGIHISDKTVPSLPSSTSRGPAGDITYDDNSNGNPCKNMGTDADDTGPSWDTNCNGVIDSLEGPANPTGPCAVNGKLAVNPEGDDDNDGLHNTWEVCKWGTYAYPSTSPCARRLSPPHRRRTDSDGDGMKDCKEAADTDGNGVVDFGGDALASARATLLGAGVITGKFGKDGDFDLNGNGVVPGDYGQDTLNTAKMSLGIISPATCKN